MVIPPRLSDETGSSSCRWPAEVIVVDHRATRTSLEVFHKGQRVALHARPAYYAPGGYATKPEHLPKAHRQHLEWTPTRLIDWGASVGPKTGALVSSILESRPHPEQGYRSCLGILRLSKQYGRRKTETPSSDTRAPITITDPSDHDRPIWVIPIAEMRRSFTPLGLR
jgi:hypothetical protein